jgi:hypothetical protein
VSCNSDEEDDECSANQPADNRLLLQHHDHCDVGYSVRLIDVYFSGFSGFVLCLLISSEQLMWIGPNSSVIGLVVVTIERYTSKLFIRCGTKITSNDGWFILAVHFLDCQDFSETSFHYYSRRRCLIASACH